ncbi:MAG: N-acetyltransferase [Bacteroidota bacterium]
MHIRQERNTDFEQIKLLIKAAFKQDVFSDQQEHHLVANLRKSDAYIPQLTLVAEVADQVVGHILLSRIIIRDGEQEYPVLALAPVSVHPNFQRQGIGQRLIETAHDQARVLGYQAIILVGHADYYPRFGYRPIADFGIRLPFPAPPENCMALELVPGALSEVQGEVIYSDPFGL